MGGGGSYSGPERAEHIQIIINYVKEVDNVIPNHELCLTTGKP